MEAELLYCILFDILKSNKYFCVPLNISKW